MSYSEHLEQDATNDESTLEANSLPDVHGKIYCSTMACALLAFPAYTNKISYHMRYATIFL